MQQILVYADSLSWGIIPGTRTRLSFEHRWPGALERCLNSKGGTRVRVIEDCLNGRRTAWDDPFKPGRNGLSGVGQRIEVHSPLSLVVLMLGTNDFQATHANTVWHSAQGIAALVAAIRQAPIEPEMPVPAVLIVSPPPITAPENGLSPKFAGADIRCNGLAQAYREVARALDCKFFDSGQVIRASPLDGIHLDREAHLLLANALAIEVDQLLSD